MPVFGLSVQRLGTSPVPQKCLPGPLPDSNGFVPALHWHCPKRALPVAARGVARRARHAESGRRCQCRAWGGRAALGFPVPARRSADSQCPVDWSSGDSGRRAVHATLYCMPSTSPCQMAVCTNLTCHVSWSTFLADHGTDIPPIYNGLKFAYTY